MEPLFFEKVRQLSYEDERRYQLLIRGLRVMQEQRKRENRMTRMLRHAKRFRTKMVIKKWD